MFANFNGIGFKGFNLKPYVRKFRTLRMFDSLFSHIQKLVLLQKVFMKGFKLSLK